jgi:hypothetical protein
MIDKLRNFIQFPENVDWTKIWLMLGVLGTFWTSMTAITLIYPSFDKPFKVINLLLGALVAATLFAARGSKYVKDRTQDPPQDGKV